MPVGTGHGCADTVAPERFTLPLTRLLICLLGALCAPEGPRARNAPTTMPSTFEPRAAPGGSSQACHACTRLLWSALTPPLRFVQYPAAPVYPGYRRDLVAALASVCHGQPEAVREIVGSGAWRDLFCCAWLLDHSHPCGSSRRRRPDGRAAVPRRRWCVVARAPWKCRVHADAFTLFFCARAEDTFVREWALYAVRNMCEVSAEAQRIIRCAACARPCRAPPGCELPHTRARSELDAQTAPTLDPLA